MMRTHTILRATRAATTLAAAALLLTACTSDPEPTNTSTGSSSNSSTATDTGNATPTPSDQSSLVQGLTLAPPQGSTPGTVEEHAATLNIGTISAGPDSTVLTYWLTGQPTRFLGEIARLSNWTAQPTLTDPAGKKIYEPVTFTTPGNPPQCLCTQRAAVQNTPQLRTIVYPPIPTSVTTVQVKMTGFAKPITAKITRLP